MSSICSTTVCIANESAPLVFGRGVGGERAGSGNRVTILSRYYGQAFGQAALRGWDVPVSTAKEEIS